MTLSTTTTTESDDWGSSPESSNENYSLEYKESLRLSNAILGDSIDMYYIGTKTPAPRSGHCSVCYNNRVFVYGGYNRLADSHVDAQDTRHRVYRDMWMFDTLKMCWEEIEVDYKLKHCTTLSCSTVLFNRKYMLIYGGTSFPFSRKIGSSLIICDLEKFTFTRLKCHPKLPKRYGAAMEVMGDSLYIHGGADLNGFRCDLIKVDLKGIRNRDVKLSKLVLKSEVIAADMEELYVPETPSKHQSEPYIANFKDVKTRRPDLLCLPRYKHHMFAFQGLLWIIGGGNNVVASINTSYVTVYSPKYNYYRILKTEGVDPLLREIKEIRHSNAVRFANSDKLILFNGCFLTQSYPLLIPVPRTIRCLCLKTLTWSMMPFVVPMNLYFSSSALNNLNECYIFGGVSSIEEGDEVRNAFIFRFKSPFCSSLLSTCIHQLRYISCPDVLAICSNKAQQFMVANILKKHAERDMEENMEISSVNN